MQILHLHSLWSLPSATCAGGVFLQNTTTFTDVHIATCTVWWLWLYFYAVVVIAFGGGCIYVVVVAVHGGFAAVTQPRIHLEERSLR